MSENELLNNMTLMEMLQIVDASTRETPLWAFVGETIKCVEQRTTKRIVKYVHDDACFCVKEWFESNYLKGEQYACLKWPYFQFIKPATQKGKRVMAGIEE